MHVPVAESAAMTLFMLIKHDFCGIPINDLQNVSRFSHIVAPLLFLSFSLIPIKNIIPPVISNKQRFLKAVFFVP
jgi:hypothetical protein